MSQTRKLAAILVTDVVGYSRLAGTDEERTLARLRGLRSDLIDPAVAAHRGRTVKRTGDGSIVEFRSVVDAVRCAIEVQSGLVERNVGVADNRRIEFRVGIHVGDVVEESDGDLMGDGVNIAARLEGLAKKGAICLSEDAYRQVKGRMELPAVDLGPIQLKNIVEPIRVYSLEVGWSTQAKPMLPPPEPEVREPPRLSIVVLPFANIGGDPEQDYFADGVTESLTTDLSRMKGAFVIGRSTAFTYKGKARDLRQIGRQLNVRYALEGSVQRSGSRMRVHVQLIEAETGAHLWAERFNKEVADLFDVQDEIVARLAGQLQTQLVVAEARRAETVPNADSMDLAFQGSAWLYRGASPETLARARSFYERALQLDGNNVYALDGMGAVDTLVGALHLTEDPASALAAGEASLAKALMLKPDNAFAHFAMGVALCSTNRLQRGVEEFERALAIDPNLAHARGFMGRAQMYAGRAEDVEAHVREALRLSPRDALIYIWCAHVAEAKACLGEFEQALLWARRSIDANRNFPWGFFILASCLAQSGRLDEAGEEVAAGLALDPNFTIKRYRAHPESDNPIYLAQRERIAEGMRAAGVPEE